MIYHQTYQVLFNKIKIFFPIFLFFFLNLNNSNTLAQSIYPIVIINKEIITNIDLENEIKILKIQFNNSANKSIFRNQAIKNLIEYKIKNIELSKFNIIAKKSLVEQQAKIWVDKNTQNKNLDDFQKKELEQILIKRLETNERWSALIEKKYYSDINLNTKEIDEVIKIKNFKEKNRENFILNEKLKKINKLSISHYNMIKKNYVIKIQ